MFTKEKHLSGIVFVLYSQTALWWSFSWFSRVAGRPDAPVDIDRSEALFAKKQTQNSSKNATALKSVRNMTD